MSWSRHGYEKASYCISQTGRQPAMQRPTAEPRIPASATGVSTQRSGPKRSSSPAVARKTPPARPTSSPITSTFGSRSSSTCRQSLTASTSVRSAKPALPQVRGRIDIRPLEEQLRIGWRLCLRRGDSATHRLRRLGLRFLRDLLRQHAEPPQITLEPADALVATLLLDPLEVDVRGRVVRRRVRRDTVRDRLDEARSVTSTRPRDRLTCRLEDGEHVASVDPKAGHPVADRLVGER